VRAYEAQVSIRNKDSCVPPQFSDRLQYARLGSRELLAGRLEEASHLCIGVINEGYDYGREE